MQGKTSQQSTKSYVVAFGVWIYKMYRNVTLLCSNSHHNLGQSLAKARVREIIRRPSRQSTTPSELEGMEDFPFIPGLPTHHYTVDLGRRGSLADDKPRRPVRHDEKQPRDGTTPFSVTIGKSG